MEPRISLEAYLADQLRFLKKFELLSLKRQNSGDLPRNMTAEGWDRELGNHLIRDIVLEVES
mgnify:CR=1 FL=1